jgi:hypothetical protein
MSIGFLSYLFLTLAFRILGNRCNINGKNSRIFDKDNRMYILRTGGVQREKVAVFFNYIGRANRGGLFW